VLDQRGLTGSRRADQHDIRVAFLHQGQEVIELPVRPVLHREHLAVGKMNLQGLREPRRLDLLVHDFADLRFVHSALDVQVVLNGLSHARENALILFDLLGSFGLDHGNDLSVIQAAEC
jgi:hypothetical protein